MDLIKQITEAKEKKVRAVTESRKYVERAQAEGRSMTGEESAAFNKGMDEVKALTRSIQDMETLLAAERSMMGDSGGHIVSPGRDRQEQTREGVLESKEYREMFFDVLSGKRSAQSVAEEVRTSTGQNVYLDTDKGATLAPPSFEKDIIDTYAPHVVMRGLATVRGSKSLTKIPVNTGKPTGYWAGEEADYTKSTKTWALKELDAWKQTALVLVSEEFFDDAIIDVEADIKNDFSNIFAEMEEAAFTTGDGVNKPKGVLGDAQTGLTTASSTAFTYAELVNHHHSLLPKYRKNGTYLMNDDILRMLRLMVDGNGRPLIQESLIAGEPDKLFKTPIAVSEAMPVAAAGAKAIALGDFKHYRIMDRKGMFFQRLVEKYADKGQIGLRAYRRVDGKLLVPEAVKLMTFKA